MNNQKHDIEWCRQLASENTGQCLSTESEYKCNKSILLWKCQEGHQWLASPNWIQQGRWCPECGGTARKNISWCKKMASEHEGECLSEDYKNTRVKLLWKCKDGHQWMMQSAKVQQGQWCPECGGSIKKNLEWCERLASKYGGKCLSTEYKSNKDKLQWQCKEGHTWATVPAVIRDGHWCPECVRRKKKDLDHLKKIALERGGKCLSNSYTNTKTKVRWQCSFKHPPWEATLGNIQQGHWCPTCAKKNSKFEQEVYAFIKTLFPTAQSKVRGLLENPRFELDIWIPEKNTGIECDGDFWHKSEWAIAQGVPEKDRLKDAQCLNAGIHLLRVTDKDWTQNRHVEQGRMQALLG